MMCYLVTAFGVCALTGAAQAGFFSFASDVNPDGPTFASLSASQLRDGRPFDLNSSVRVDVLYDADEDGPAGPTVIPATFEASTTVRSYTVIPFGGQFIHAWTLAGTYRLKDLSGTQIFVAEFSKAVLTSWSESASLLGTSASLQDNINADSSLDFLTSGALAGAPIGNPNFSFSLTALTQQGGARVPVATDGSFLTPWKSEGSWSAQAIPMPGTLALLGIGAGMVGRRRR